MRRHLLVLCVSFLVVSALGPAAHAQKLIGGVAGNGRAAAFTADPAGPCSFPNSELDACQPGSACPGVNPPGPTAGLLGDVAVNRLTDTVWITDGLTVHEISGDAPCSVSTLGCAPIESFRAPSALGPLTGLGMDSAGGTVTPAGTAVLWMTDGASIAAVVPGPGCTPPTIVSGPTPIAAPVGTATDISWDPVSGSLWVCGDFGIVANITTAGALISFFVATPGACPLAGTLVGIAVDTSWPATAPLPPGTTKLFVTDGLTVDYVDDTGAPAATTFYSPVNCTTTPDPLNGLALAGYGVRYGSNRINARIGSFGQSSSPGPTWGLELNNAAAGDGIWLAYNYNFPVEGFYCPAVFAQGTRWWVDPGFPGGLVFLGTVGSACMAYPLPLGGGLPSGLTVYVQFITTGATGPPITDATEGLSFTIQRP